MVKRTHATGFCLFYLVSHIDLAGGIFPDENHSQPRSHTMRCFQRTYPLGDFLANLFGEGFAINAKSRHFNTTVL